MLPNDPPPGALTFTVYDIETGEIIQTFSTNDPEQIAVQCEAGRQLWIEGAWDQNQYRIINGVAERIEP